MRSSARNEHLSGNPLDADNPLRLRGKFGVPKKPKRVSRTKKNVMQVRENVSKAKELAKSINIEAECIHHDSELTEENLRNILYLAKLPELRETLKCLNEESETDQSGPKEAVDSSSDLCVTDFRKVVKSSSVPAHLLLIHHHNFKR